MSRDFFEDESLGKAYDLSLIRRFMKHLAPYRWAVAFTFMLIALTGAMEIVAPLILMEAMEVVEAGDTGALMLMAGLFLGVVMTVSFLKVLYTWITARTGQRVIRDLRTELFGHLLRLPMRYFDRNPSGRLLVRVSNDIENLNELFASGMIQLFADILVLIGFLAVMVYLSPMLTLVALLVVPAVMGILFFFRLVARRNYREIRRRLAILNAYLAECIQGMRVIKMFNRQAYTGKRFGDKNTDLVDYHILNARLHSFIWPAMELVGAAMIALILWIGGASIFEGTLTFGAFLAFWYCVRRVMEPLRDLSERYNVLQSAMASSERIFKILDTTPESPRLEFGKRDRSPGRIEFRNVTFGYNPDHPIIHNVSFEVPSGKHVALVGATGSGKTTLVSLMLGFYRAQHGQVLIDGRDVGDYDPGDLRRRFGMVGQDVFLFSGTIQDNIRLEDPEIPMERVRQAASTVSLGDIIARFPGGFETNVRERGLALSAGERQLISLARAFCVDSSILLLDEATSYVDMHTDHLVHEATTKILEDRTAVVVAHRLATVRSVDQILVMHRGRIVEAGTHRELLDHKGVYERLCRLQFESATA